MKDFPKDDSIVKSNNTNNGSQPLNENYRGNGVQTPTYKKPSPMPPIKPAKPESNKKQ